MVPLPSSAPVDELERETSVCIKALQTASRLSARDLLGLLDRNSVACEELNQRATDLDEQLRELLRATDGGSWAPQAGDWLGIFQLQDFSKSLEQLIPSSDTGPVQRVIDRSASILSELDARSQGLKSLRCQYPALHRSVCQARDKGAPLATGGLSTCFQEALSWRRRAAALCDSAGSVCRELQEILDSRRARQDHKAKWRERWRGMTKDVLTGAGEVSSVRIRTMFWLKSVNKEVAVEPEAGAEVLASQVHVLHHLERRLTKCAAMAMRVESDFDTLKAITQRINGLREMLFMAAKEAEETRYKLLDVEGDRSQYVQDAAVVVRRCMKVIDQVEMLFSSPSLTDAESFRERSVNSREELEYELRRHSSHQERLPWLAPQQRLAPRLLQEEHQRLGEEPPAAEDVEEFRSWVFAVLVAPQGKHRFCGQGEA